VASVSGSTYGGEAPAPASASASASGPPHPPRGLSQQWDSAPDEATSAMGV
jgi:hypothetical protein